MNATDRKMEIFELLVNQTTVNVAELSRRFNVTPMTIRRDLSSLEKQGIVTVFYGGAALNEGTSSEPTFLMKSKGYLAEKMAIAYQASRMINEGDSVYIDCGTTCYQMARFMKNSRITVLTNSVSLIPALADKDKIRIIVAPGTYSRTSEGMLSASTIDFFSQHHVDKAFVSSQGFDLEKGASVPEEIDAKVKASVLSMCKEAILLADHSKFNQTFFSIHGAPSDYSLIITDEGIDPEIIRECEQRGLPLKIAPYIGKK